MIGWIEVTARAAAWWRDLRNSLADRRLSAGLTQRELARILRTRQGNVSHAERDVSRDDWKIGRTIAWLAAVGQEIVATSPAGETCQLAEWGSTEGGWLAQARQDAQLSQRKVADMTAAALSTVQGIEAGRDAFTTTIVAIFIACGWEVEVRTLGAAAPVPSEPTTAEQRKIWRNRARGRALTRLARELHGQYMTAYRQAQRKAGGELTPQRARDVAVSAVAKANADRFQEIYQEELGK